MFILPKNCLVDKFIPKKAFYEKIGITTNIKEEFVNLIDKIIWLYKISPDTLGVNNTEKVEEIQIFELILKEKKIPKNAVKTIAKGIQYPILFIIRYNDEFCYCVKIEDSYFTEWNDNINISFKGINLEYIYNQIVKNILKEENNLKSIEEVIKDKKEIEEIEIKISQTKNKMKTEKQFNRKVELNKELRVLEIEMEKIANG